MSNAAPFCVFCKKTTSDLKLFNEENLIKCSATLITRKQNKLSLHETLLPKLPNNFQLYHSECYRRFTALPPKYRRKITPASVDASSSRLPYVSELILICFYVFNYNFYQHYLMICIIIKMKRAACVCLFFVPYRLLNQTSVCFATWHKCVVHSKVAIFELLEFIMVYFWRNLELFEKHHFRSNPTIFFFRVAIS